MFDQSATDAARRMLESGTSPSSILRHFAVATPDASVPDLMQLARGAFGLTPDDTACIGGWWHDGSGELSDRELDGFLRAAIAGRRAAEG